MLVVVFEENENMIKDTIKLPVDKDNQPDYSYMDSFIRRLKQDISTSLVALQSAIKQESK